jgi:hypothetical protein
VRAVSNGIVLFIVVVVVFVVVVVVVVVVLVKHWVTDHCISRAKRELSLISGACASVSIFPLVLSRDLSRCEEPKELRGARASATCSAATGRGT